jgi:hypothetical protein
VTAKHGFSRDLALSAGAQAGSMAIGLFGLAYIGHAFGEVGIGSLSVINRTAGGLMPLLMLGTSIYLAREWARPSAADRGWTRAVLLSVAALWMTGFVLVGLAMLARSATVKAALGGESGFADVPASRVVGWVLMALGGLCAYNTAYCAFRGQRRFGACAVLQLVYGALPLAAGLLAQRRAELKLLPTLVGLQAGVGLLFLARVIVGAGGHPVSILLFRSTLRQSLAFGVPRLPVFFLNYALYGGPVYVLSLLGEEMSALRLSVVLSLVRQGLAMVSSFGLVALPTLRQMDRERCLAATRRLVTGVGLGAWGLAMAVAAAAPWVLRILFNVSIEGFDQNLLRLMLWVSVGGGLIYELLRNVNDALFETPFNTLNAAGGFLVGGVVIAAGVLLRDPPASIMLVAVMAVFAALGVFTTIGFDRNLRLGRTFLLQTAVWAGLAAAVTAVCLRPALGCGLVFGGLLAAGGGAYAAAVVSRRPRASP